MLLLLSLLWGGSFFFYKVLDEAGLPPLTIVLGRVAIATLTLLPVLRIMRLKLPASATDWWPYIVIGVGNNLVPYLLIAWGETQISSGLAAILNAMTPIFTAIVAHFATRDERFSAPKAIGIVLGFAGVLVLVGSEALRGFNLYNLAQLACLTATVSYAFTIVYAKRLRGTPPLVVSVGQLIAASVITAPLELIVDKPWTLPGPSLQTWLALFGMAVIATAAAYILYFALVASAGAVNASLVTLLVPPCAIVLGGVFLHERLSGTTIAGMLLIFVGLLALDGRLWRSLDFARSAKPNSLRSG
jgi:drug/metabolite transporter (DMT)-like permease